MGYPGLRIAQLLETRSCTFGLRVTQTPVREAELHIRSQVQIHLRREPRHGTYHDKGSLQAASMESRTCMTVGIEPLFGVPKML